MSFNINFYEMSFVNFIKRLSGKLYNVRHAFHVFRECHVLCYIRLVKYKDICNGYITLKTRLVM